MKRLLILSNLIFAFCTQANATCKTSDPKAEAAVLKMFQVSGSPVDWIAVKERKDRKTNTVTVKRSRAFRIQIFPSSRLNTSEVEFESETYSVYDTKVCFGKTIKKKRTIKMTRKGQTMALRRFGRSLKKSVIRAVIPGITIRLRPSQLLGDQKSVTIEP